MQITTTLLEEAQLTLQTILTPYQQEQNQRQKKLEFLKSCLKCFEKDNFFQLDELLSSKQAQSILTDPQFQECESLFKALKEYTNQQIDAYQLKFKDELLQLAEEAGLPMQIDIPRFSVLKGIEGTVDFNSRQTTINQVVVKSVDPKRIIAALIKKKRQLFDAPFDVQKFIEGLFQAYSELIDKANLSLGEPVPIRELYKEYVWSLQNKNFFQNMEKGKFKGYSLEQFAVDLWRYFQADHSENNYQIKLNSGRGGTLWLIDQDGERRNITQASFRRSGY